MPNVRCINRLYLNSTKQLNSKQIKKIENKNFPHFYRLINDLEKERFIFLISLKVKFSIHLTMNCTHIL